MALVDRIMAAEYRYAKRPPQKEYRFTTEYRVDTLLQQVDDLPDIVLSDWNTLDVDDMSYIKNKPNVPILDLSGLIPASYLPSYVDDILEYPSFHDLPQPGEPGKIYVTTDNDLTYRWSGTTYVEISKSIITGVKGDAETDYRIGNVNLTAANIGLGNVVNLDLSKAIKGITRNGLTFTYTCLDGTTGTFTQQDNNTTYSAGTGLLLTNTAFSVKLGYTTSGNNRAVQADVNGNLYVTQKDDNTTYSAGTGLSLTNTTFALALTKKLVTDALGYTPPTTDTNTHRPILVNGTLILGDNTTALNLKAGSNVTLTNSSGTVTIASTDTNTWRGIQDNLTSSTNTTESLSAKLGYLLANGSARDNTKLPLAGGTMTGALTVKLYIFGYNYNHAGNNAPAFVFDKTGSNYTGIGAHSTADTIWFGAATISNGEASWVDTYKQKWVFNGAVTADNFYGNVTGNLTGNANTATTATNADTVDDLHASNLVRFFLSPMTAGAPADSAKSWFTNTMPSASGAIVYNVPGSEKTIIAGKSSGSYGHMLQLNYDDTYLKILRYKGGNWLSTDWEKISAGYADSAGSVSWSNVTGKPSTFTPSSHTHSYLPLSGGTVSGEVTIDSGATAGSLTLDSTHAVETALKIKRSGTTKAIFGYKTGLAYIYNNTRSKYLKYNDDGTLTFEDHTVYHSGNCTISDTKNTAGSSNIYDTKIYLIGAKSLSTYAQTYSTNYVYIDSDNAFHSTNVVATTLSASSYLHVAGTLMYKEQGVFYWKMNNIPLIINAGTGTLNVTKAWVVSSDIRKKDIISDIDIPINAIAESPIFNYKLKDVDGDDVMVGTSALYWLQILPNVVKKSAGDYLAVDYGATALTSAITVARKVVKLDKKIKLLEEENKQLKEELLLLKSQINDILTTINKSTNNE